MSLVALFGEFFASLTLISISGYVLTGQLERLGARLHFTPGLLGVVVALGADSPEIAAAITALVRGHGEVSTGVVLGSNIFNVACLLGVSAIVAKNGLVVSRAGLLLSGGVALLVTLLAAVLIAGWVPAGLVFVLVLPILVPYVVLSSLHEARVRRWPLPTRIRDLLCEAVATTELSVDARPGKNTNEGGLFDWLAFVPTLAAIVGSSVFMVESATALGDYWRAPGAVIGILVLATLTGIPNLISAIRLASHGRSTAVVSETLNSNSLNVVFGLCLPAVIIGTPSPNAIALVALVFLPGLTLLGLILTGRSGGLRRTGGVALLGLYAAFVVTVVELSR